MANEVSGRLPLVVVALHSWLVPNLIAGIAYRLADRVDMSYQSTSIGTYRTDMMVN